MELLIAIAPILIVGVVGYFVVLIQEWIADVRFYRRRTQKELDRIRRSLGKMEYAKTTLPTGEVDVLGPGKVYIFGGPKTGIVTGTVGYEQLEEMGATLNEAEKLIKEARERRVGDIG